MFKDAEQLARAVDAECAHAGLQCAGGTFIRRTYVASLAGRPARAELSVLVATHIMPSGYVLTIEVDTGISARWTAGRNIPLLIGRGLTAVGEIDGAPVRGHDAAWTRRFTEDPGLRAALSTVVAEASFLEHLPTGTLRMQFLRVSNPVVPALFPLVSAFDYIARAALAPPHPAPAQARFSDRRDLVLALIAVVVIGVFGTAFVAVIIALQ